MNELNILKAISSTEVSTFGEFCGALGTEKPTDRIEWRQLFLQLEKLEVDGLVEIECANKGGSIETLILTDSGAAAVKLNKLW